MSDLTLGLAQLVGSLFQQSACETRVAAHLLRLDLRELYEFGARNPAALAAEPLVPVAV